MFGSASFPGEVREWNRRSQRLQLGEHLKPTVENSRKGFLHILPTPRDRLSCQVPRIPGSPALTTW